MMTRPLTPTPEPPDLQGVARSLGGSASVLEKLARKSSTLGTCRDEHDLAQVAGQLEGQHGVLTARLGRALAGRPSAAERLGLLEDLERWERAALRCVLGSSS